MQTEKVSAALSSRLAEAQATDLLDVVVELRNEQKAASVPIKSGAVRLEEMRTAFQRNADPVARAVEQVGGEITGKLWLNQTVRMRVPASQISRICELNQVQAIDVPRRIESDLIQTPVSDIPPAP